MGVDPSREAAEGGPSHGELIDMAQDLVKIAVDGDHGALSRRAASLLQAFVRHSEAERPLVLRMAPITARLVEHGQQRVVDHLVSLVLEADLAETPCRCAEHAEELSTLLALQVLSEELDQQS